MSEAQSAPKRIWRKAKKKSRKKKKKSAKKGSQIKSEPLYKCMECEYVPCICSSVGTWGWGW
jgi:hypothetical protein